MSKRSYDTQTPKYVHLIYVYILYTECLATSVDINTQKENTYFLKNGYQVHHKIMKFKETDHSTWWQGYRANRSGKT